MRLRKTAGQNFVHHHLHIIIVLFSQLRKDLKVGPEMSNCCGIGNKVSAGIPICDIFE